LNEKWRPEGAPLRRQERELNAEGTEFTEVGGRSREW